MSADPSSTGTTAWAPTPEGGERERTVSEVADGTVSSRTAGGDDGDGAAEGAAEGVATRVEGAVEAVAAGAAPAAVRRPEPRPWAVDRVLAAAVGHEERKPTFRDLLRHNGALTKELGKAEQAIGGLTVERDALRGQLEELRRRAPAADPLPPVDAHAVAEDTESPVVAEASPPVAEPETDAAVEAADDEATRRRWLLAALLLAALALLLIGWWALDPSFGLPWGGDDGAAPTPGGAGG